MRINVLIGPNSTFNFELKENKELQNDFLDLPRFVYKDESNLNL